MGEKTGAGGAGRGVLKLNVMKIYIGKNGSRRFECEIISTVINVKRENVVLNLECYEIDENGNEIISETTKRYDRTLLADNSTKVDMEGNYVSPDTVGAIGEWDYFDYIRHNVPIKVAELEISIVQKLKNKLMPDGLEAEEE